MLEEKDNITEEAQTETVTLTEEASPVMTTPNEDTQPEIVAPNEGTQPEMATPNKGPQPERVASNEEAQPETVAPNEETQPSTEEKDESEQILKQPWLNEDEIFRGKERFVDLCLYNTENDAQKLHYDRKEIEKSTIYLGDEESNWSNFKNEALIDIDQSTDLIFNVLGDLRSHTLVTLGKDRLSDEIAQQHLKVYKNYLKVKEERIMLSVEKVLRNVERKKAQKSRKKIDFAKSPLKRIAEEREESSTKLKEAKISEVRATRKCHLCNKQYEDLDEHLLMVHYKTRILDEYPSKNFKCFFPKCSFVTIPRSFTYVKHVGLHHKILKSLVEECDKIRYEVEDKEQSSQGNFRFQCPYCPGPKKQVPNPMAHLSTHFTENIKEDFPFIKNENGSYICPIADCSLEPKSTAKLAQHINLDHQQINIYLKDANLEHMINVVCQAPNKKRKL